MNRETINYILLVVTTLVIATVLAIVLRKILSVFITKYAYKLNTDPTKFSFIKNSVGFIIYTSALIFIFFKIPYLKSIGTALFAGAGIFAIVVGFASQKAFSNIIAGIFILIFKPFKISDIIEFKDGKIGVVEEITLRHTLITDYENRRIIIPNSEPCVIVRVIFLSDFSVDLKAYIWTSGNDNAFIIKCDLLKSVKQRFDREGIEIPFPYRTIVYKNDLKNGQKET